MFISEFTQVSILGITMKDVITAILIPIIAVLTTLTVQAHQQARDRRMHILRMLLATRHLPATSDYNAAINLIPIEFNRNAKVMNAWRAYIQQVRFKPAPLNERPHNAQTLILQTKLITAMMDKLGLSYSSEDIQADAYASEAFMERESLYLGYLRASGEQAEALKAVARSLELQARLLSHQSGVSPAADSQ